MNCISGHIHVDATHFASNGLNLEASQILRVLMLVASRKMTRYLAAGSRFTVRTLSCGNRRGLHERHWRVLLWMMGMYWGCVFNAVLWGAWRERARGCRPRCISGHLVEMRSLGHP